MADGTRRCARHRIELLLSALRDKVLGDVDESDIEATHRVLDKIIRLSL